MIADLHDGKSPAVEQWDAYDSKFERIPGMTLTRSEAHLIPSGVYHLVCDVLVRHTDGTYLLMRRDPRKAYPGLWEATAGGSALRGETALECALRELREETGIAATELVELTRLVKDTTHSVYVEYLCITGCDKGSVVLQEGETVDYRWVTGEEVRRMTPEELLSERMRPYIV